jgi:hypothetical protein
MADMVRKHITVPREIAEEFEKLVGERNQSAEIAALMEARLKREMLKKAFRDLADSSKSEHPEWEGEGAAARWLRESRGAWGDPQEPRE